MNIESQMGFPRRTDRLVRRIFRLFALTVILCAAGTAGRAQEQNALLGFGDNYNGELGSATNNSSYDANTTPTKIASLSNIVAVAAGNAFTLALDRFGNVWACGDNYEGELGNATNNGMLDASKTPLPNPTPTKIAGLAGIVAIAAGYDFGLALDANGNVWGWGDNYEGNLGSTTNNSLLDANKFPVPNPTPAKIAGLSNIAAIAAGYDFSVFLDKSGNVWACGDNYNGQLGSTTNNSATDANGFTPPQPTPTKIAGLSNIAAIAGGFDFTLALDSSGNVWAFGDNYEGELGSTTNNGVLLTGANAYPVANPTPTKIVGLPAIAAIVAGADFSIVLDKSGNVWGFGGNYEGQLGSAVHNNVLDANKMPPANPTPTEIAGLSGASGIAAGDDFTFVIEDGALWGFGDNYEGQLGSTTNNGKLDANMMPEANPTPTKIAGLTGVVALAIGFDFTLAITHNNFFFFQNQSTGQLAYWGEQYEDGVPTLVSGNFLSATLAPPWKLAGVADFNGDGQPDLLWWNATTGQVAVWYMNYVNGDATISGGAYLTGATTNWHLVGVGDFNSDGYPDLLWQNTSTGAVAVWYLHYASGAISVTGGSTIVASNSSIWTLVGAADFNKDGYPDLLWRNTSTGDVVWWEMAYKSGTPVSVGGGYIAKAVSLTQTLVGAADLNGDGEPDLLWRNASTDQLVWWKLAYSGGAVASVGGGYLPSTIASPWTLSGGF